MGSLKHGDFVIGSDGNPVLVTGVFPQGRKEVYRLTTENRGSVRQREKGAGSQGEMQPKGFAQE